MKRKQEKGEIQEENLHESFCDRLKYSSTLTLNDKCKSITSLGENKLALSFSKNDLQIFKLKESERVELDSAFEFSLLACNAPIRGLALSSNDQLLVSASGDEAKLWSLESQQVTLSTNFPSILCCQFLPKNRFVVLGNKEGKIALWDISSAEQVDLVSGHEAAVWSLSVHSKPTGYEGVVILSGGADRHVRFWELVLKKQNRVGLVKAKEIYLEDEVLAAKWSQNGDFYAVATLDSNIRIFFSDSDKLFLALYGHKFPALSFSFSDDGALLASGSADKSIKVWGMDFGDLHKSIRAHEDSVTSVAFVNNTHYLLSASKDCKVKFWDLDSFSLVLQFEENLKEVWTVIPSSIGDFFIAGGNDRVLRLWKQTQEQVFVEEEEQRRMEKVLVDEYAEKAFDQEDIPEKEGVEAIESAEVLKQGLQGLKYGDEIMAKIDFVETFREEIEEWESEILKGNSLPPPVSLQKIGGVNPGEYVIKSLGSNSLSQLENSLKFLHLNYIEKLLLYIAFCARNSLETEICCRTLNFILKTHESSIIASPKLLQLVKLIQKFLPNLLQKHSNTIGYNLAALKMMREEIRLNKEAEEAFAKESLL